MDYLWGDGVYDDRRPVLRRDLWWLAVVLRWWYWWFSDLVGIFAESERGRPWSVESPGRFGCAGGEVRRVHVERGMEEGVVGGDIDNNDELMMV